MLQLSGKEIRLNATNSKLPSFGKKKKYFDKKKKETYLLPTTVPGLHKEREDVQPQLMMQPLRVEKQVTGGLRLYPGRPERKLRRQGSCGHEQTGENMVVAGQVTS